MEYELIILLLNVIGILALIIIRSEIKGWVSRIEKDSGRVEGSLKDDISRIRQDLLEQNTKNRSEIMENLYKMTALNQDQLRNISEMQKNELSNLSSVLVGISRESGEKLDKIRDTVEDKLKVIQEDNNKKLDEMRATVDEKLHQSLEKRLSESFSSVSERLEKLYKQLGEMNNLANGVNELKRALTNVKTRGIFGEIQLKNIISDILTPEQYDENISTKKGSNDRVEFAVKLPGLTDGKTVYLPIDAKFPQEDFQRLMDAEEAGDKTKVDEARKALISRIKGEAKDISVKYLDPPYTTDFGILFLATEGLYAEFLKSPGLIENLQRDYKVVVTGPSTISAFLNSLNMGFRTLAVEKRSAEVWELLGTVKNEFNKFGDILDKTQKKLQEASNTIESASKRTRIIQRKLKDVEEIPNEEMNFLNEGEEISDFKE